jgi:hypothetical protein
VRHHESCPRRSVPHEVEQGLRLQARGRIDVEPGERVPYGHLVHAEFLEDLGGVADDFGFEPTDRKGGT